MAKQLDPKEMVSVEELVVSHMWEMAALVELLEERGILTKQDLYNKIDDIRRKQGWSMRLRLLPLLLRSLLELFLPYLF